MRGGRARNGQSARGIRRGWDDIRPTYERWFSRSDTLLWVEFFDYTIHDLGQAFVAIGRERATLESHGTTLEFAIRPTRIFIRRGGRFRQLHHHGSIDNSAQLERYQAAFADAAG